MASTVAASAYFLTCCRPGHNAFCFCIEKPKFINFYHYPFDYFLKNPLSGCKNNHDTICDHSLSTFHGCTDERAWSLDANQQRQHFQDIISYRIPQCEPNQPCKGGGGERESSPGLSSRTKKAPEAQEQPVAEKKVPKDDEVVEPFSPRKLQESPSYEKQPSVSKTESEIGADPSQMSDAKSTRFSKKKLDLSINSNKIGGSPPVSSKESLNISNDSLPPDRPVDRGVPDQRPGSTSGKKDPSEKSLKSKEPKDPSEKSSKSKEPKEVIDLTDELIEKLDRNLRNLESTFDKFVKKNRDFIQNLVECLGFEKEKQKLLEDDYNKLKQENEELKTQNDYLKMVNDKQLDLFKNELDKGISENKVIYKRKIHLMERQLQNDQNEIQTYKETERRYMEVVEQDNEKIEQLNNKVDDLKRKEVQLVKNYLQLLRFLQDVKNILSDADPKDIPKLRKINTMTEGLEGENEPDVKRVLKDAMNFGIVALNVRDLSILHDAIEGVNGGLCHQTDKCTKSPTADSSYPDFDSMSIHRLVIEHSIENVHRNFEGYDTTSDQSIDKIPTRQKPGDRFLSYR